MNRIRFLILVAIGGVLAARPLFAQAKPRQHADEPVTLSFAVNANVDCGFEFSEANSGVVSAFTLGHAGIGTWSRSAPLSFTITPGKSYEIHLYASTPSWNSTEVRISAAPGYQVFVTYTQDGGAGNGAPRSSYVAHPIADHHYAYFTVLPQDGSQVLGPSQCNPPRVADLLWAAGLGQAYSGRSAGSVMLRSTSINSGLFDPSALVLSEISGDVQIAYGSSGEIRQIFAPQTFVDVYPITQLGALPGFEMDFYLPETCPSPVATITPTGSPYASIFIQNDHDYGAGVDRLRIERREGSNSQVWRVKQSGSPSTWTLEELNTGGRISTFQSSIVSGQRHEAVELKDASNVVALQTARVYNAGDELITEIADPSGAALTTTYDYYDQSGDVNTGNYGRLKSILRPDGSWVKYEYYGAYSSSTGWTDFDKWGQLKAVYKPWRDSVVSSTSITPANASSSNCDYTLYDYASERGVFSEDLSSMQESVLGQAVNQTEYGPTFGTSVNSQPLRVETVHAHTASGSYLTTTRKIFENSASNADYVGHLYSQTNPDGSKTSSYVHRGSLSGTDFVPGSGTTGPLGYITVYGWSTAVTGGVSFTSLDGQTIDPIYLVPNRSTRSIDIQTTGFTTYHDVVTQLYTGGTSWVTLSHQTTRFDGGYKVQVTGDNGYSEGWGWSDGNMFLHESNDGIYTGCAYDDIHRMVWQRKYNAAAYGSYPAQGWLYTHYQYDAAGHVIWQRSNNSDDPGVAGLTTTSAYDYAGRITSSTDSAGLTTSYSYSNGGRTVTTTVPGGGTKITDSYIDGSPKSVTGTAVPNSYQATTLNSGGTITTTSYALRSSDLSTPTSAPRWSNVTADWAGRKISEQKPAPGSTTFTRNYYYNSTTGNLTKTTEHGLADTLTDYNEFGEAYRTGLDLNASGTLVPASTDRLTEINVTFAFESSAWWRVTTSLGYNQAGGSAGTAYTSSITKERLTGFSGTLQQESTAIDLFGNSTHHTVDVDRTNLLVTDTTDVPDSSTNVVKVSYNGLTVSQQSAQNLTTYFHYDTLGRLTEQVDPRLGTSTTAYATSGTGAIGQVSATTDPAGNTTSFAYDSSSGRLASTTNALGKTSYQSYNIRGQVTRAWGQTTYPVEYAFNDYGEQTTMSTFRGGTGWDGSTWPGSPGTADTTTWAYDAATGTLTSKTDAASHAVIYTYNTRSQLATRTWGRGTVATYSYSSTTAEQTGIGYSDSTPAIAYTYNRMGQTSTVADVTGTRTFAYSTTTTALASETFPSYFDSRVLTRKYDTTTTGAIGRNTGFTLSGASGSGTDSDASYGYESHGLFNSVSTPSSGPAFTYTFTTNSNLVASIAETSGWTETNSYEAHRNLLTGIIGAFSSTAKAQFAYTHDAIGRRLTVVDSGEIFSRYVNSGLATHYGYNDRSEVTSAQSYYGTSATDVSYPVAARGFTYAFDNIGSRTTSAVIGTDAGDVHTTSYTNNNLNQVTSRSGPGSADVSGYAPTAAGITVNGAAAVREGEYYYKNISAGSTPSWLSLAVANSLGGSSTRYSFIPAASETHAYDLDGNLTADGRWNYTWDAENRLVSMETVSAAYGVGTPRQLIQFEYDYLGRRVKKTVANWSGSAYVAAVQRKFIYNGWNLIGEYNVGTSSLSLVTSYLWGLDLSGNLVDGGGVGGLLGVYDPASSGTWHLPLYDANGNVHALVNRSSGTVTAAYEYSPYGETLRATGTYAAANNFRFSTKYTDSETQFIYYGYRYYNPSLGRWLGRDPSGESGGIHLYAFCNNNPINAWDKLGMIPVKMEDIWDEDMANDDIMEQYHPTWQKVGPSNWLTDDGIQYNWMGHSQAYYDGLVDGSSMGPVGGTIQPSLMQQVDSAWDQIDLFHSQIDDYTAVNGSSNILTDIANLFASANASDSTTSDSNASGQAPSSGGSVANGYILANPAATDLAAAANQALGMHSVTVQTYIATPSAFGFAGDDHGPTSRPSLDYRTTSTITFNTNNPSWGSIVVSDTGTTTFLPTGTTGHAPTSGLTGSETYIAPGIARINMTGSASDPLVPGAPPAAYNLNLSLNFNQGSFAGGVTRTDYPSTQVFVDGRPIYNSPQVGTPLNLYNSTFVPLKGHF